MSEYIILNGQLYHHGIKGMKWGIRRYQNEDGSLTADGRKRYSDNPEIKKLRNEMKTANSSYKISEKAYRKASNRYSYLPTKKNEEAVNKSYSDLKTARSGYKKTKLRYTTEKEVARLKDKNVSFEKKSKHRLKLEEQYKKLGMTDEQAQAAANKRIRTEKILAASAAITVTACAAYVANKKFKDRADGIIKAGEKLQRVEMQNTNGKLHDVFFVAKGDHDIKRYENLLGFARKQATGEAYALELKAAANLKVASKDKARAAFGELYKNDPEFKKSVIDHVKMHFGGSNIIKNVDDVSDRNLKKMYDNFNSALPIIRGEGSGADKKFYDKLKAAGYGAIHDINDMKYSGYAARTPFIVFDNSKGAIMVQNVRELTGDSKKGTIELLKATGESIAKDFINKAGPLSAAALAGGTVVVYVSDPSKDEDLKGYSRRKR